MADVDEVATRLFDVVIIGAGISGINAAYWIQTATPTANYTVLEARANMGGTWSLFNYPGFPSDSDIYPFDFAWRQWQGEKTIVDGN